MIGLRGSDRMDRTVQRLQFYIQRPPFPRARSGITPSTRLFALITASSFLISAVGSWADPPSPPRSFDERLHATGKAIIAFHKTVFTLLEDSAAPIPHVEILVALDGGGNAVRSPAPASRVEPLIEIDSSGNPAHPRAVPTSIRIAVDDLPVVEHFYSELEEHALVEGGLQRLLAAPFAVGRHTVAVTFRGISQSGKSYLKTTGFTFQTARPVAHVMLRFRSSLDEEPQLTLTVIEQSLLESPLTGSGNEDLVYRLGVFANGVGDYGEAVSFFLASLDRPNPVRSDETRLGLAEAYAGAGLTDEAEAVLHSAIAHNPDEAFRARAWLLIERLAFRDGRHAQVIEAYDRIDTARLGSTVPSPLLDEAHLFAGTSALILHQYSRAAAAFRRVTNPGPDSAFALYGQAQAVAGSGDAFTAADLFKKLTESRSPSDPVRARVADFARAALGFQWLQQGRYGEALSVLGQVRSDHPAYEAALFGVGWAFRTMGEHVKAIAIFQELIDRFPHGEYVHEARLAMASSYTDLRAYTRAVTAYRAALEAGMVSLKKLDRLRGALDNPHWDPVTEQITDDDPAQAETILSRSVTRYRGFLRSEQELRRTLDRVQEFLAPTRSECPSAQTPCPTAREKTSQPVAGAHLVTEGRTLSSKLDALKGEFREVLKGQAREVLDREQQRLEEWSVQAGVGIAKNLIADRDELGSGALTLD